MPRILNWVVYLWASAVCTSFLGAVVETAPRSWQVHREHVNVAEDCARPFFAERYPIQCAASIVDGHPSLARLVVTRAWAVTNLCGPLHCSTVAATITPLAIQWLPTLL